MGVLGAAVVVGIATLKVVAELGSSWSKSKATVQLNEDSRRFKEGFESNYRDGLTVEKFVVKGELELKGDFSDDDLGLLLREKALERCEHEYHRDDVVPVIDDGFNTSYSYAHVPLLGVIPSERTNLYGLRRFHCESSEKTKD